MDTKNQKRFPKVVQIYIYKNIVSPFVSPFPFLPQGFEDTARREVTLS